MKKWWIISIIVILFLSIVMNSLYTNLNGTKSEKVKAKSEFELYLSKNFSQSIVIDDVSYNWKSDSYGADVHVKRNKNLHFRLGQNGKEVYDDYFVNSLAQDISNKLGSKVATIFNHKATLDPFVMESVGVFPEYVGDKVPNYFALQKESSSHMKDLSFLTTLYIDFSYDYSNNKDENQKLYQLISLMKKEIPYAEINLKYKSKWFTLESSDIQKITSYEDVPKYFIDNTDLLDENFK